MAGLYGAGRFLPQDFSAYQAPDPMTPQDVQPADPGMAYQPNYNLFWNPRQMLELGSPQFASPWYNQTPMQSAATQAPASAAGQGILGSPTIPSMYQGILTPSRMAASGAPQDALSRWADQRLSPGLVDAMMRFTGA